jgi:transcriptional regulator with XRE-family HTH domain
MNQATGTRDAVRRLSENPAFSYAWAVEEQKGIVGANVAVLRHAAGLTQAQLAQAAGMKQPRIAELERGDANPTLETLVRVARALGATVGELHRDRAAPESASPSGAALAAVREP